MQAAAAAVQRVPFMERRDAGGKNASLSILTLSSLKKKLTGNKEGQKERRKKETTRRTKKE